RCGRGTSAEATSNGPPRARAPLASAAAALLRKVIGPAGDPLFAGDRLVELGPLMLGALVAHRLAAVGPSGVLAARVLRGAHVRRLAATLPLGSPAEVALGAVDRPPPSGRPRRARRAG